MEKAIEGVGVGLGVLNYFLANLVLAGFILIGIMIVIILLVAFVFEPAIDKLIGKWEALKRQRVKV